MDKYLRGNRDQIQSDDLFIHFALFSNYDHVIFEDALKK